jgi:uncharacterized membrane protein
VFVMKWMSASPAERGESYLTLIVVAIVVSTVIDLLADAGVLPGDSEAWTLTYAIVPVSLAWALLQRRSDEET